MSDDDSEIEFSIIFYNNQLQITYKIWKQDNNTISIAKTVNMHKVSKSTLQDCINDVILKIKASQNM